MSWVRAVREWTTRSNSRAVERRPTRQFDHVAVEALEPRLCLGGLTAPPAAPESDSALESLPAEVGTFVPTSDESFESTPSALDFEATPSPEAFVATSATTTAPATAPQPSFTDVFASEESNTGSGNESQPAIATPPELGEREAASSGAVQSLHGSTGDPTGGGPDRSADDTLGRTAGLDDASEQITSGEMPWWMAVEQNVTVRYDFRDSGGHENLVSDEEQAVFVEAFQAWTDATDGKVVFVQDTTADVDEIMNVGIGDMAAYGQPSETGGLLGLGGGRLELLESGEVHVSGAVWLDGAETWDLEIGNGDVEGTYDFFTVAAHETGHVLGYDDSYSGDAQDIMNGVYRGERNYDAVLDSALNGQFYTHPRSGDLLEEGFEMRPMTDPSQLTAGEVDTLLQRASAATPSQDAIIAVVDRNGRILGVRVEQGVLNTIPDTETLIYAIDGAVAKARTAAFFSNGDPNNGTLAPLTSRLVQFLSQSTITQREVESNPNVGLTVANNDRLPFDVYSSTLYGPGLVAPVGVGGHFPPGVEHTPPVDLFAIEHTNRDGSRNPGPDGILGTNDDIVLNGRFDSPELNGVLFPPDSYGVASGLLPKAQGRGIATLPGGIPLFRDSNGDGLGDTLVGGIGVFFPGENGDATFEQNFQPGIGQTQEQRLNASKVLEAEYIAFAAAGGSRLAEVVFQEGGTVIGDIAGIAPVNGLDLPFGRLDLVGISLPVFGPCAGKVGLHDMLVMGRELGEGVVNGANQTLVGGGGANTLDGMAVAEGFLVPPKDGNGITAAQVTQIINQGIAQTQRTRAAVRLPLSSQTRMVLAVTDLDGEIVGLFRQKDATVFSIDVAVAKARNATYYAGPNLQAFDQVNGVPAGTAFSARTFRFLSEPRFPSGVDGSQPPQFSILNQPSIDVGTAENVGAPSAAGNFDPTQNPNAATVLGYDSFFPSNNFQDPNNPQHQNGVVFFPGSTPLYNGTTLLGGLGISGDGVDQDDVVTFVAAQGFLPQDPVLRADNVFVRGVRLPFQKFLRNPEGSVTPFS